MIFYRLLLFLPLLTAASPKVENLELSIIHMNDTHSHFDESQLKAKLADENVKLPIGGYERLFQRVDEKRRALEKSGKNVLVLHGGDAFQGTIYFTQNKGKMNAAAWKLLRLDAMALGNHEFDIGSRKLSEFLSEVDFPVLAANIDVSKNKYLKGKIKPFIIKQVQGRKVGIIGLTPETLKQLSLIDSDLVVKKEIESTRATIKVLKKLGVQHIIVLDHIGYENDLKLAKAVDGIDVIVGGHSHTLLGDFREEGLKYSGNYPTMIKRKSGEQTCVVQAWQYSKTLGQINIIFDTKGRLLSCKGNPELLLGSQIKVKKSDNWVQPSKKTYQRVANYVNEDDKLQFVSKSSVATSFMEPYRKSKRAFGDKIIGYFDRDYLHPRSEDDAKVGVPFKNQSQMAKIVAESYLVATSKARKDIDFAMVNSGGVRTEILKGDVTVNHVYELLPFSNELYIIELKGKDIVPLINSAINGHGGLPMFSGLDVDFVKTKSGFKVSDIKQIKNGKRLDIKANRKYKLVTLNFLFKGGDGYDFSKTKLLSKTGILDNEAFYGYVVSKHPKK